MNTPPKIQVVGSINMDMIVRVDRFPREGETITGKEFLTAPGGKGANQAVAAARLGATTAMIGCVGIDQFGKELVQTLKREKVSMRRVGYNPEQPTGTAVILVDRAAKNQIVVTPGANHTLTTDQLHSAWKTLKIKPHAVLLQLEIPMEVVVEAAIIAKQDDALVILNPSPVQPLSEILLKHVDYVVPNEHEAKTITGDQSVERAAKKLQYIGAKHVVVTLGEKGAILANDTITHIKPFAVQAIDPTAAGDAFVAGFVVALLEGKSSTRAVLFANAAGALATTKLGAQPSLPTRKEVENLLSQTLIQ